MDLTSNLFLIVSISAILTSFTSANPQRNPVPLANPQRQRNPAVPPEIKAICAKTANPVVCSTSIVPYLDGKSKGVSYVLQMQMMAVMDIIETAIKESKRHSKEQRKDKIGVRRFKDCKQLYSDALDYYKNAVKALKANNLPSLQSELDAVHTMISTCDDTVTGDGSLPDSKNPLNQINILIKEMNGNCYDLQGLLK